MIKITNTTIHTNKVIKDTKILVISDIHYMGIKDNNKLDKLYDTLNNYKVDYICIVGDLVDNKKIEAKEYFINWLKRLSKISTIIISLGNHDIRLYGKKKKYSKYYDYEFYNKINKLNNVYLLNNNSKIINDIYFYGYTQSFEYYYDNKLEDVNLMKLEIDKYDVSNTPKNKFNILLMHSPIHVDNKDIKSKLDNYDLILSGHMHNGVVLPIIDEIFKNNRGIIAPNKRLFPKNARGIIKDNNIIVISSGITKIAKYRFLDLFFPIGINYIVLTNKDNDFKTTYKYHF